MVSEYKIHVNISNQDIVFCARVVFVKYEMLPFERIRNLRIDNDLTQKQVAGVLGVKQNTYSQYEIGVLKYPIDVLIKLAYRFETSIDYLVGITDVPTPYPRNGKI
jgi:transcriptional regulator with XRE-family HTH domain